MNNHAPKSTSLQNELNEPVNLHLPIIKSSEDHQKKHFDQQFKAVTLVGLHNLKDENTLMVSKWPAYRFMTPLAATELFAAEKAYPLPSGATTYWLAT